MSARHGSTGVGILLHPNPDQRGDEQPQEHEPDPGQVGVVLRVLQQLGVLAATGRPAASGGSGRWRYPPGRDRRCAPPPRPAGRVPAGSGGRSAGAEHRPAAPRARAPPGIRREFLDERVRPLPRPPRPPPAPRTERRRRTPPGQEREGSRYPPILLASAKRDAPGDRPDHDPESRSEEHGRAEPLVLQVVEFGVRRVQAGQRRPTPRAAGFRSPGRPAAGRA